jgi:hypothetical protein
MHHTQEEKEKAAELAKEAAETERVTFWLKFCLHFTL